MQIFFLFILLVSSAFAVDSSYLLALTESDPSAIVDGKVNVITGDLYLVESDLRVQGYEPIPLVRSYMSHERGDWMFIPHVNAQVERRGDFWVVTEKYGTPIVYRKTGREKINGKKFYRYEPVDLGKGFSNTSQGIISGATNLKNNYLLFDEKYKEFTLCSADESKRRYCKNYKGEGQFRLISEKLPSGKQIAYEYQEIKDKYLGTIFNLTSIATKNLAGNKTFAKANFIYEDPKRKNKHFFIQGSDKASVEYQFRKRKRDGYHSGALESVVSTIGPDLHLKTIKHRDHRDWSFQSGERVLTSVCSSNKKALGIEYYLRTVEQVRGQSVILQDLREPISECEAYVFPDPRRGKVKTLQAPVGPDGSFLVTHSFLYDFAKRKTTVYDITDCRTEYLWNEDFRLQKIDRYDPKGTLHNGEEFQWKEGNLQHKSFFDDKRNVLFSRQWLYDSLGNVKEETLTGDLTGEGKTETTTRRIAYEKKWPSRQEEEQGLVTLYQYVPGTNLIKSKSLCDGNVTKISYSYEYDADLVLVREIIDDGISKKIRQITPRKCELYYGMPEIIEEKYEDQGCEKLLRKTIFHYGKGGKVTQKDIYDADDVYRYSLKTGYDEKGRQISETNAMGWESTARYDEAGNKIFSSDCVGNTIRYTYDTANRLIQKEEIGFDGISRTFLYTYDTKNNLISETDGYGNVTKYVRTPFGEIGETYFSAVLDANNSFTSPVIRSRFDTAGNEIERIDQLGLKRQYSYNARGKPISIQHPGGGQEKFIYYPWGALARQIDVAGLTTDYNRDYLDRIISKTFTHNNKCLKTEKFDYSGLLLTAKIDPENHQTFYFYDRAARKIAEECEGEKKTFYYDSLGRINKTEIGQLQTLFQYDLLDRLEEQKEIDATTNQLLRKATYQYDRANNITLIRKSVDGQDTEESFGYDSRNRLIWHISSTGAKETFFYNNNHINQYGQKVLQKIHTDPHGLETIETYDALSRLINIERRKEKTFSESIKYYNHRGDLCLQIDEIFAPDASSRQIRTKWDYDISGRVSQLTEAEGTLQEKITKYTYTLRGDKETVTKPNGVILKYVTNPFGDVIKITSSDNTVAHEMRYDNKGNLIWNDRIEKNWDAKGRLISETFSDLQHVVTNTYNHLGQRTDCKIPLADCWIEYQHNPLDMIRVSRKSILGLEFYSFQLLHDLSGNLQQIQLPGNFGHIKFQYDKNSRKIGLHAPFFSQTVMQADLLGNILALRTMQQESQFTYDDLYQLISERSYFHDDYLHDSLACRIGKNNEFYQIDNLNQLISHFEYDKNGNPKRQGDILYSCDALDRLIYIETEDAIYTYTYDAMHRRISSIKNSKKTPFREVHYFIYDGQNEIGSFDEQGNLNELRVLGPAPHAEIGATLAMEINGKTYLSIPDLCGNIAALLPFRGDSAELTHYSAFGEEIGSKISPWRFSSKRTEETGLVYFGRRYYLPSLGRWLTPDPLGFHDSMNLYAYVHNNPLNHFDEYGLLDFGQHEQNWHQHSERWHKAAAHEVSSQILETSRFLLSTPYYIERGVNALTGRQNLQTETWQRCHNRFFNSVEDLVHRNFSTDMTHPDYWRMRNVMNWSSTLIGGYGLAKGIMHGGMRVASWGMNTWRGCHPSIFTASRPATSVVSSQLLKNKLISEAISKGHAFEKHILNQGEFPGWIRTRKQFGEHIENVINNPTSIRELVRDRVAYWHQETGTAVIHDPRAIDRGTAFQPFDGVDYFDTKLW